MTMNRLFLAALVCIAAPALAQETVIEGELAGSDARLGSGEHADSFRFEGRAGQSVSISMQSESLDPYLLVRGPAGFAEDNDDLSDGDRNARLELRLPADGEYRVVATSFAPGETGPYRLLVDGAALASVGSSVAATESPAGPARPDGAALAVGGSASGGLADGDETLRSGEYLDRFVLRGPPGTRVAVGMTSTEVDPYLILLGSGGLRVENDDDPAARGSRDSRAVAAIPASGELEVIATSYRPGESGRYMVTAQLETPAGDEGARPATGELRHGQPVSGALAATDPEEGGKRQDIYLLSGRAGERIVLGLESSDFDPFLSIVGEGGFAASNDDDPSGNGSLDSRLEVVLPQSGSYRVIVSSYEAGALGGYVLTASEPEAQAAAPEPEPQGELALDSPVSGTLAAGDSTLNSGEYVDHYRFSGSRGQRILVEVSSADFDTFAILNGPGDFRDENDDGVDSGGRSTDSRLSLVLPETGEYRLAVTSYRRGETGSYRVALRPGTEPSRQAAVQGGPRVFALMVGVSDYGGRTSNLPLTDQDATKLRESLARAGVLNPASVTLVNSEATRPALEQAVDSIAGQIGPEDLFLFFFSGHGNQVDVARSAAELDGRLETIELFDSAVTDAELGDLVGRIRSRMSLLVFDSCFSGGMNNLVNRPGVMAIFSSEEDLTSVTAGKYEAGGFLAYFVRSGMSGEADSDGDRVITAGELAQYVRERFYAEDPLDAHTREHNRNYQHLVIDRGGVHVDDVILRI